ncbi:GAF domain-containing protein [Nocardioides alkalitolerans]|uniref:GAF domain-containing protein n=1 Tax=Nocardioides alkalitolerans TaxID=281714 RepID=UPI0003F7DB5C|nr:GAF domain-containing protein [Nocardioides alkalitolerans]
MSRTENDDPDQLGSPHRLADLEASGLLDHSIAALDALTLVACNALGSDITAAVTAVSDHDQLVVSISAAAESLPAGATTPLSHSMCKNVVVNGAPHIVDDASLDDSHALAFRDHGVGAYAGFPLRGSQGTVLGAVCATTPGPRRWNAFDLQILGSLATAASSVVAMHTATHRDRLARISGAVPADPFARIQHGLRTPLTSLFGFLDLMLDGTVGDFTPAQLDALRRCHTNAERLREAVEALG